MMFKTLTALSGVSLIFFGFGSLALSAWANSLIGIAISVAILGHGIVEMIARNRLFERKSRKGAQVLIVNQLAIAVSVSLYAVWQIFATDPETVRNALQSPLMAELLALYPAEILAIIDAWMPRAVLGFYILVIVVVWLGCAATAAYYRSASRKLLMVVSRDEAQGSSEI